MEENSVEKDVQSKMFSANLMSIRIFWKKGTEYRGL